MHRIIVSTATFIALLLPASVWAQKKLPVAGVFKFSIVEKTPAHPFFGIGSARGYAVNEVEGDTLYIVRDSLYAIDFDTLRGSDIPISYTRPRGRSSGIFEDWNSGAYLPENLLYIQATDDTPDTLYYGHFDHEYFGGTFVIVDSLVSSVSSRQRQTVPLQSRISPNPIATSGLLSFGPLASTTVRIQIVDVLGRVVGDLSERTNAGAETTVIIDRDDLSSGLYFYRVVDTESNDQILTTGSFHIR